MPILTSKRRKLDHKDSSSVLFKPFKSPLKVASPEKEPSGNLPNDTILEQEKQTQKQNLDPKIAPQLALPKPSIAPKPNAAARSSELNSLRREESRQLAQLAKLRVERDQIKQAAGIEKTRGDAELTDLIAMWRSASQQAAEEVYAMFRDKVNASGGLKCWREIERARKENAFAGWEDDGNSVSKAEIKDDGEEDEERNGGDDRQAEEESDERRGQEEAMQKEEEDEEEEEYFSMDVMLHYLGIELDVIGYDSHEHRWLT